MRGVILLLAGALVVITAVIGCMGARATDRIVAESGGSFVRVERDPSAPRGVLYGHPVSLSPELVRTLLGGVEIESRLGPFRGEVRAEPLFDQGDLDFLAPAVSAALQQARPDERVVFYLRQSGRLLRSEITTGAVAIAGDSFRLTLGHYRRTDVEGLVQEDRQAGLEHELRDDPMRGVFDRGVRLFVRDAEATRGDADARSVRFRLAAGDSATGAAMTAPVPPREAAPSDSAGVKELQGRVKALTDSNQELRATIKALQDKQAQVQSAQQAATTEELARLRQELAELKQLLADKVLELNRLKGKSEAAPSPSR